ncbi:MAG: dienelactone hydrolase family protein [Mycobacterium sp.]
MQTITINAPGGPIDALLSVPDGKGPWPGVVLVHDAFGYGPDNERISRKVAAAGYIAITPNMFARGGMARCVTRVMRELLTKRGRALDDILAARDHLLALPQASGAVGIAGFCMGGQFALVLSPKGFGASAPFYGTPLPRDLSETLDGACPIVASFGRRDPIGIGAATKLEKVTDEKNIPADIKAYSGAGHSFANKLPAQPLIRIGGFGYNEAAEADAWSRVFAFFGEHLQAPTG